MKTCPHCGQSIDANTTVIAFTPETAYGVIPAAPLTLADQLDAMREAAANDHTWDGEEGG
jgi:hypothetical protein